MRGRSLDHQSSPSEYFRDAKREYFGDARADYSASKRSQYRRWRTGTMPMGTHADWHYRVEINYFETMEQARDMYRNDAIIGSVVDRAVGYTVHGGIRPRPNTGDKVLNTDLRERFEGWADNRSCSVEREYELDELETLALTQTWVDGDMCAIPLQDGSLQLIEAHRLRTPSNTRQNVVHGVLLEAATRRRLQYWFTKEDVNAWAAIEKVSDMTKIDAQDDEGNPQVFHVLNPKRITQTRGMTAFAPIFDRLGMIEDIDFATMIKHQVSACFAIFRKRESGMLTDAAAAVGPTIANPSSTNTQRTVQGMAPGMEVQGMPGEELQGFSPNIPSPQFEPHLRWILTLVGVNLGMPLVLSLMEPGGSFSAYRGAVDQAKIGFRRNQKWLVKRLHKPTYRWKLRQMIADDPILARVAERMGERFFSAKWHLPAWPYIDPQKDAAADLLRMRNCLSSPRRIMAERGMDWDDVFPEIVEDNFNAITLARSMAIRMNKKFAGKDSENVHWRELLSLPTPDGVTVKLTGLDESDATEDKTPAALPAPAQPANPPVQAPPRKRKAAAHG